MKAYDIALCRDIDATREDENVQGWCFGLPPGIKPNQWPLDPNSGYPLMHSFTLKVPDDWREQVGYYAVSFFAIAPEHCDGCPAVTEGAYEVITTPAPSSKPGFSLLFEHARNQHPKLHRMEDILGCAYAAIPLTKDEYHGSLCSPPFELLNHVSEFLTPAKPAWLEQGAAFSFCQFGLAAHLQSFSETFIGKALGRLPQARVDESFPFQLLDRLDPNAGKKPVEVWDGEYASNGYETHFETADGSYALKDWAKDFGGNHLGGTMMPSQSFPDVSPCYVEFEEYFGGHNFGGGNAQLCLKTFIFDWACG